METNKLITFSVGIVVAVILVAALLIPVIEDAEKDRTSTFYNASFGGVNYSSDDGDHTIKYVAGATTVEVDGTAYTLGTTKHFVVTDSVSLLASTNGITVINGTTRLLQNYTTTDLTLTLSGGTSTLTYGENTSTQTYTWCFVLNANGNYALVSPITSTTQVYCSSMSDLYGNWWLSSGHYYTLTGGVAKYDGGDATVTGTIADQANTDGEVKYLDGALTLANSDTTYSAGWVLAPASVSYVDEFGRQMAPLLAAIPLIIIVSIVVATVGLIAYKSRD